MKKPALPVLTEHEEQVKLCQWLTATRIPFFAVPNAAKRGMRTASRLKAEGMVSGAPDLVVIRQSKIKGFGETSPVAIEMKRTKGSITSQAQKDFHEIMRAEGWIVIIAKGANDAINQLIKLWF